MASAGKKFVRAARQLQPFERDVDAYELLVLMAIGVKETGRDPKKLADGMGVSARRVTAAWDRVREKGLIRPVDGSDDPQPICELTADGRRIASDAVMAIETSGYEPRRLRGFSLG